MPLNDVPLALTSETLQNTQNAIRQNFLDIGSGFAVDHQALASGPTSGYHKKLTMPQQTPAPAGIASTAVMYYFTDNELYLKKNNGTAIPFTKSNIATEASYGDAGYTYLPSGLLMKWGFVFVPAGPGTVNVNFPTQDLSTAAIPTFAVNGFFGGTICLATGGNPAGVTLSLQGGNNTTMQIYNSSSNGQNASFFVIGK